MIISDDECLSCILGRQSRLLWLTYLRESRKCTEHCDGGVNKEDRQKYPKNSDYWDKLVNVEESTAAFLTAIATLVEDASEITLALYVIIGHGERESTIGQF